MMVYFWGIPMDIEDIEDMFPKQEDKVIDYRNKYTWKATTGQWYTTGLFWETASQPTLTAVYTLSFDDKKVESRVLPGFYRLYMELEDPTEYEVAERLVGGLEHWKVLCESPGMQDELEKMRTWLAVKLKSKGMKKIIEQAPESFQAAKYLTDQAWMDKTAKAKVRRSTRPVQEKVTDLHKEDFNRVFGD